MNIRTIRAKYGAKLAVVASSAVAAGHAFAQAADPTSGTAAITQLRTQMGDYGPVMFGLAIISVGIMIGVKWIKRAKGAA